MRYYKLITTVLLMLFIAAACNKNKQQGAEEVSTTGMQDSVHVSVRPVPVSTYTDDSITINAYNYKGLAHFLNNKNDTTYVVNFWATWCLPCVKELPYFEELNSKYKGNKIKVLLVSLDMHKTIEQKLLPFIKSHQLKSEVIVLRDPDADSWIRKIDTAWSGALPATLIYNSGMRKFYEKSFTYSELEKEVSNFK